MTKRFSSAFYTALEAVAAMEPEQTEQATDDAVVHADEHGNGCTKALPTVPSIKPRKGEALN